ncbi:MAG: response regulator [Rudaea sp.]
MKHDVTHGGGPTHALVVDDQPSTTMLVGAMLGRAGYRVDQCASAREAIAAIAVTRYDLIVLDLNLPDMPGLDLLRDWKSERLPPVVGMTSGVTAELVERAGAVGMNRILEKPVSGAQLIAAAAAAIRDTRSLEIVTCDGAPIAASVLAELRTSNGEALFRRFVEQALADAWHCTGELESAAAGEGEAWLQHARTLDGVARSLGARRLTHRIAAALLLPIPRLRETASALTRQFIDLLDEAQEALGAWMRQHCADAQEDSARHDSIAGQVELTEREREVLRWTAVGKTVSEIAATLGISARTVTFHITNILRKLDAANKTEAVSKAMALDLIR